MRKQIIVLGSDAVNRYNSQFVASGLEGALRQRWNTGAPCNLGHDQTKPTGWVHPISLYFEPGITRLIGLYIMPETPEELEQLNKALIGNYCRQLKLSCAPFDARLRTRLSGIASKAAELVYVGCAALMESGLARKAAAKLFERRDKDGLIDTTDLNHLGGGVFEVDGLALFASRRFRRSSSLLNSINYHFFENLSELQKCGTGLRIALDEDLVGEPSSYRTPLELAYWWGPPFTDDLKSIPPGVTVHGSSDFEKMYTGIVRSEFWWQSRKGEHILEMEELREPTQDPEGTSYCCRYVHSIIDEKSGSLCHLDGAMRCYDAEQLQVRLALDISKAERQTEYVKLWRLDSNIPTVLWKRLVSDFYRDNHLVGEYLGTGGVKYEEKPETAKDIDLQIAPKQRLIPYGIDQGSGVRVNLCYCKSYDNREAVRLVTPIDSFSGDSGAVPAIDLWTWELRKIIRRRGSDLTIPKGITTFATTDLYVNLPLIIHGSNDMNELALTVESILEFVKWSIVSKHDRVICINLKYPLEDRGLQLSIYGHCSELLNALTRFLATPPRSNKEIENWVEMVSQEMAGKPSVDRPIAAFLLRDSGIFWFKRHYVTNSPNLTYEYVAGKGLRCGMKLSPDDPLYEVMKQGEIQFGCSLLVEKVTCTKCGKSFLECECSVVLDGTKKQLGGLTIAGVFLTDRSAYAGLPLN